MRINIEDIEKLLPALPVNMSYDEFKRTEDSFVGDKVTRYTLNPEKLRFDDAGSVYYGDILIGNADPIPEGSTVTVKEVGIGSYKILEMDEDDEIRVKKYKYEEPFIEISVETPVAPPKPAPTKKKDARFLIAGCFGIGIVCLSVMLIDSPILFVIGLAATAVGFVGYYYL